MHSRLAARVRSGHCQQGSQILSTASARQAPGASDVYCAAGIYTFTGHGIALCAPTSICHDPLPDTSISVRVLLSYADDIQAGANTIVLPARLVPAASR